MKKIILLLGLLGFSLSAQAQRTLKGQVLETGSNTPLVGVSVVVQGTATGTSTDFDGNFTLNNLSDTTVLVFSYLGYQTTEVVVGQQTALTIHMEVNAQEMEEVIVTALNIERDKESLGYSVAQIDAQELNVARENNVMNSLSGKVSGLQITQTSTGVDASSRVLLRGVTTISGSNRPLVVVDGVPINNQSGGASSWGGVDRGDALSDINPDDVASVSVLKGAGAAAAYGSLGMNGVILITTKSGTKQKGVGVSINSTFSITDVYLTPDLQNEYGTGAFGGFAPMGGNGRPVLDYPYSWSWGPKMEGQTYTNWLGQTDTFSPQGNPYEAFYQSGYNTANSVSFEGRSDKGSFRMSFTDERSQGIVSNNTLRKQTYGLRGSSKLTDNLQVDGRMTYLTSKVENRPQLAEGSGNTALQLSLMPRDIRLADVEANTVDANGNEIKWNLDNTFNNPYWALQHSGNTDEKDRFQGYLSAQWDISNSFNIQAKTGMDYLIFDYTTFGDRGAQAVSNGLGSYSHDKSKQRIWNTDVLATYSTNLSAFDITATLGTTYRDEYSNNSSIWGNDSKSPGFYNISNYKNSFSSEDIYRKGIYSLYALGQFSYGGFLYLDATVRNDHSSTLPKANNSYWYHSENISLLFTKLLGISPKVMNYGKIRGSYAKVGNDTSPYRTQAVYNIDQTVTLPYTVGSIPGSLPSTDLRPEISKSWEVGAELGFFDNRLYLDFTYYQTKTNDQIMAIPISGATAYSSKVINAGRISNEGIEADLTVVPFRKENFEWSLGANFTKSDSKVDALNEGLESITLGSLWNVSVEARPGEEFGTLYGNDFLRDNFGRKLITDDGYAQKGERAKLGSINPDWYGGLTSKIRYKDFSLNALVSMQKGGEFYSYGRAYRTYFGTDARTLAGREGGLVEDGINEHTGFENTVAVDPMLKHFNDIFTNEIAKDQILDATNIRLRELTLTWAFNPTMLRNTFIQGGSLSLIGRNLFFFYNAAEDIDPESGYSSGPTGTAFEHSSLPATRTYGLNLKLNF